MATRYSGDLKINVTYRDRGDYACTIALHGINAWKGTVRPPAMGFGPGIAYDSPEAYDSVARAAVAFAIDELPHIGDSIEVNMDMTDTMVHRSPPAKRQDKQGAALLRAIVENANSYRK